MRVRRRWLLSVLLALLPAFAMAQTNFVNTNTVHVGWTNFCDATGTSSGNTYACDFTTGSDITAYRVGVEYAFLAPHANTGAATINFSGVGAKTMVKVAGGVATALVADDIRAGQVVVVRYDGTNMQMVSQAGTAPSGSGAPGGTTGQAQYNAAGTLGGSSGFRLDGTQILGRKDRITTMTTDLTLTTADGPVIACTAGATTRTATLPVAATTTQASFLLIKVDSGAGECRLAPASGERINNTVNGTKSAVTQFASVQVSLVDTTTPNWHALSGVTLQPIAPIYLGAASCQGTAATLTWDVLASGAPTAACYGTNRPKGVADFGDSSDMSMHLYLPLPTDWVGPIDARVFWFAAATTNVARFGLRIDCFAADEDHDGAVTNSTTFAATPAAIANRQVITTVSNITTTGCAAGELARIDFFRDGDGTSGTDSMTGNARVEGIELQLRRAP